MLAVPIEENPARKNDESLYDENLDKILECLSHAEKLGTDPRMMQVRITAFVFGSASFLHFIFWWVYFVAHYVDPWWLLIRICWLICRHSRWRHHQPVAFIMRCLLVTRAQSRRSLMLMITNTVHYKERSNDCSLLPGCGLTFFQSEQLFSFT